jgi:transcriptional regulator with XRE-family HTH domain
VDWTPDDWTRLGTHIRTRREQLGLSRRDLAGTTGISMKKIQLAEEGWVPVRWPKHLEAIGTGLGWAPGAAIAILNGGLPPSAPPPMDTARAELTAALQQVRETTDYLASRVDDGGTASIAVLLAQQTAILAQRAAVLDAMAGGRAA